MTTRGASSGCAIRRPRRPRASWRRRSKLAAASLSLHEPIAQHAIKRVVPGRERRLVDGEAGVQQQRRAFVMPAGGDALPTADRAMDQPAHGGPVMIAIARIERRMMFEYRTQHDGIAVPGGPV